MAVSKRRMGLALARWLGCVGFAMLCQSSFACDSVNLNGGAECSCVEGTPVAGISRNITTGAVDVSIGITQCSSTSDTTCAAVIGPSTASPQFYKHTSGYYKCDWVSGTGFSNGVTYTPGAVTTVSAPIIILDKPTIFSEEVK